MKRNLSLAVVGVLISFAFGLAQAQQLPSNLHGAYFGAGVLVGGDFSRQTISLKLPNGQQRNLTAEIVSPTAMAGLRFGWGAMATDNLYLGAELEGSIPFVATQKQAVFGTTVQVKAGLEFAGFARLGWSPDGSNLLFVRAGAINLNRTLEAPQVGYRSGSTSQLVPAFGLGAEVAVSDRVSFRLDLTHAKDNGATDLQIFQGAVGLTYRF